MAPLKDKKFYYHTWLSNLSDDIVAEKILKFCAAKCSFPLPDDNVLITDVIEAYPGAISPYALRKGLDSDYRYAAKLYSESKFNDAADFLREAVNLNGITAANLCLLGASLRLSGQPEKAMPYLIMCTYLNPKTDYLIGNIILCLKELKFKNIQSVIDELEPLGMDSWSKSVIQNYNPK